MSSEKRIGFFKRVFQGSEILTIVSGLIAMGTLKISESVPLPDMFFLAVIISGLVAIFLYFSYRKYVTNLGVLLTTLYLLIGVFPLFHYQLYLNNPSNYSYGSEYLNELSQELKVDNSKTSKNEILKKILGDCDVVTLNRKILDEDLVCSKDYIFMIHGTFKQDWIYQLNIHSIDGRKITSIHEINKNNPIKSIIGKSLLDYEYEINKSKNPRQHVFKQDFWIESVRAFVVGDIKPMKFFPKLLTGFQVILGLIVTIIITNSLNLLQYLNIKRNSN